MRSGAPGENASQSEEKGNESRAGPTFSGPSAPFGIPALAANYLPNPRL